MSGVQVTKQEFSDLQKKNYPLGLYYYIQQLDDTTLIYHGLIIATAFQLFAEFTSKEELVEWYKQEKAGIF